MRLFASALLLALASASGAQDLDVRFSFPEAAAAEADSALLGTPRVQQAYELDIDGDGWTERLLLSFTPREDRPGHASLNNFVAETHEAFLDAIPDRTIRSIEMAPERNPLAEAGLPFAAYGFFRPVPEGPDAAPVCDSAALFFESDAGFWTLSWNAPRGWLRGELGGVLGLVSAMEVRPLAPEAPALAAVRDAAPLDAGALARVGR